MFHNDVVHTGGAGLSRETNHEERPVAIGDGFAYETASVAARSGNERYIRSWREVNQCTNIRNRRTVRRKAQLARKPK